MSNQKPKISFNTGPSPRQAPVVPQTEEEFVVQAATGASPSITYDGFDREEWERQLSAPKPVLEPASEPEIVPRPYEPFTPTPKQAGFSPIGFFKKPPPRFFERPALPPVAAAALGAVAIGVVVAVSMGGDDTSDAQIAKFSAPAEPLADPEVTTRAAIADMTMTAAPSDLPEEKVVSTLNGAVAAALPVSAPVQEVSAKEESNEALETLSANKLRMLRESVLAGAYRVETYERAGAQRIRLSTQNARLENPTSSHLMLDAIARNEMKLSKALYTTAGAVDVETMMFNLVQASLLKDRTAVSEEAALDMSRKIFAASPARSQTLNGLRYYAVQEGDSLAYIALQFYGRPAAFPRILEANPDILQSPDKIQTGQLIHIPR